MSKYLLAIDQGTTSSRAIIFSTDGKLIGTSQEEFPQYFPHDAWVEHQANEIWQSVLTSCQKVLRENRINAADVISVGITNQRETTLVWDKITGETVYPAIVWQDRRTADYCAQLIESGYETQVREKTGLLLDPYFSASKLRWILNEAPTARQRAEAGELLFGTIDSYLIWKLTKGRVHATDATNASRTLLFNIHTQQWDDELLTLFDIPAGILPEVKDSADDYGEVDESWLGASIPINGVAGDQHAALIGQTCFSPGMAKSTYGTGCFLMLNTGAEALESQHRLLTTVAYRLKGTTTYALEGSIFIAGAAIQWLRDGLHLISSASETQVLAEQTKLDHGVYLVPAFTGLGAPYWDPNARGAIFGLTRDTGIKEIVTAGLQSVCYQTKDLQKAMENDGVRPTVLRVDGGMVANDWVLQHLSDILGAEVDRPEIIETTALGAAYLAGLYVGLFESLEELASRWRLEQRFSPTITKQRRDELYSGWLSAVEKVKTQ